MKTKSKVKNVVVNYPEDAEMFQNRIAEVVASYIIKIVPPEEIGELIKKMSEM